MRVNKYIYNISKLARQIGFDLNEKNDARIVEIQKKIGEFGKIEFKIEQYPDGSWTAESVDIDGIITGGKDAKDISLTIKDAVFTYFEIPPHLCVDSLLKQDNEPVVLKQHVYA